MIIIDEHGSEQGPGPGPVWTAAAGLDLGAVSGAVYLDEFASADLRGVVVVGEGHAQLASFHEHGGLKHTASVLDSSAELRRRQRAALYLEFLPPNGLHVAFLADGEGVGDPGVCGVDLAPGEGVSVLGHLCDQPVVAAFLDDVSGDTCEESRRDALRKEPRLLGKREQGRAGCASHRAACRSRRIPPGSPFPIFRRRPSW